MKNGLTPIGKKNHIMLVKGHVHGKADIVIEEKTIKGSHSKGPGISHAKPQL